jgi:hypothetical protein
MNVASHVRLLRNIQWSCSGDHWKRMCWAIFRYRGVTTSSMRRMGGVNCESRLRSDGSRDNCENVTNLNNLLSITTCVSPFLPKDLPSKPGLPFPIDFPHPSSVPHRNVIRAFLRFRSHRCSNALCVPSCVIMNSQPTTGEVHEK